MRNKSMQRGYSSVEVAIVAVILLSVIAFGAVVAALVTSAHEDSRTRPMDGAPATAQPVAR